jgi:hypothetical protein
MEQIIPDAPMKLSCQTSVEWRVSKCASLSGTRITLLLSGKPLKPLRIHLTLSVAYEGTRHCATNQLLPQSGMVSLPSPLLWGGEL